MKYDIVIVNWNSGDHLRAAVDSVLRFHSSLVSSLVIVDNASVDGSAEFLEGLEADFPMRVLRNSQNRGFGAACNQGAAEFSDGWLIFLNPDAELRQNSLSTIAATMMQPEHASVGIVGVQNVTADGRVARSCSRFPSVSSYFFEGFGLTRLKGLGRFSQRMIEWDHLDSRVVDQVIGAFFVVRRAVFDSLGGFDERFFVYYEEVDFCLRAREEGWSTFFMSNAQVMHFGGGTTEQVKAVRLRYSLVSRVKYVRKHFGAFGSCASMAITFVPEFILRMLYFTSREGRVAGVEVVRGYFGAIATLVNNGPGRR